MNSRIKAISQIRFHDIKVELHKGVDAYRSGQKSKPLVSYIGWTGHGNLGDEILFDAHRKLFPRVEFVPYLTPTLSRVFLGKTKQRKLVAGFLGGGTLINQSPAWIKKIEHIQALGRPVYCFGTGVTEDAFRLDFEDTNLQEWTKTLSTMRFVGIRGPRSQALLQEAGFDNAQIIGDTALALAPEKMQERVKNNVIGFNYGLVKKTQIWGDEDVYTQNVANVIKKLIADGYEVRLLPVWKNDIESNKQLLSLVAHPKCTMRECFNSLDDYTRELDQCGLFIGQKLHATIMACMERIPSIMIEYQPKCRDFMASLDMEHCVIKTSECTPEVISAKVLELESSYVQTRKTLDEKVSYYRRMQFKLAAQLEDDLLASTKV